MMRKQKPAEDRYVKIEARKKQAEELGKYFKSPSVVPMEVATPVAAPAKK